MLETFWMVLDLKPSRFDTFIWHHLTVWRILIIICNWSQLCRLCHYVTVIQLVTWRFPAIGIPPVIIHFYRIFHYKHYKPSSYWGTSIDGTPHIMLHLIHYKYPILYIYNIYIYVIYICNTYIYICNSWPIITWITEKARRNQRSPPGLWRSSAATTNWQMGRCPCSLLRGNSESKGTTQERNPKDV